MRLHRPPAPIHAEVTAQDAVALEAEQEVLAVCLNGFEAATVESLCYACGTSSWMDRLDG